MFFYFKGFNGKGGDRITITCSCDMEKRLWTWGAHWKAAWLVAMRISAEIVFAIIHVYGR